MRFLFVNTDYSDFLTWLYSQHPGLEHKSYEEQVRARAESCFGVADFYSSNLSKLGHESIDVDANNEFMQKAWARQHGVKVRDWGWEFRLRRGLVPWFSRVKDPWFYEILAAQIKYYKPDVLINHTVSLSSKFFREMKPYVRLLIGNHASPLPKHCDFGVYDLMLSVTDNFVAYFRREGIRSELLRLGFEPRVLNRFADGKRSIPVSFVGNLRPSHASRRGWLEEVCHHVAVDVWSPSMDQFPDGSATVRSHRGSAWGVKMYEVLNKSRITLNHHIDVAETFAGNVRLFEATGAGCLLITDWKQNLHEMFEPGKEVVAYRTPAECVELINHYLEHDDERAAIAQAGHQRTMRDHTYHNRMQQLLQIVQQHMQHLSVA